MPLQILIASNGEKILHLFNKENLDLIITVNKIPF